MMKCIFCKSIDGSFKTREHILPESLGGGDWAILPPGLYCDSCQNRFGSAIEQQALGDYPFALLRVFLSVPTKKGRAPWFDSWEGEIGAAEHPGLFAYEPASPFVKAIKDGTKTQLRILAEPRKPSFICRTLLKMGLETLAADDAEAVFSPIFDEARSYALTGNKTRPWWYLQIEDHEAVSRLLRGNPRRNDLEVSLGTNAIENEGDQAELFHLRLYYLSMMCPLEGRITPPPMVELEAPRYRLFVV